MLKKFSFVSFKKIILLTLFSLPFLLITINIPTPFGGGDKLPGTKTQRIKDPRVKKDSVSLFYFARTPQAAWRFLKSQRYFVSEWRSLYTNWLDFINKRKPQKTFQNIQISTVINLKPLWDVNPTDDYDTLTSEVKKVLSDLSKIVFKKNRNWSFADIMPITYRVSLQKETSGTVYKLIKTLKDSNRWSDLIKYQIKAINDVNIESLLKVSDITSLSATASSYNDLSNDVKVILRNLLDLDVESSERFNIDDSYNDIFSNSDSVTKILTALGTRIDNVIKKVKENGEKLWDFLKANNRLKNIKAASISSIADIDVSSLHDADFSKSYETLSASIHGIFYDLLQVSDYKIKINDAIQTAQITAASNAWTFLTTSDRLKNLKQYNLNPIKDVPLLLILFQDVTATIKYINLTNAQKTLLYNLSQVKSYQPTINNQIAKAKKSPTTSQKIKTPISDIWKFLQTNNRLKKLQANQTLKTSKFDLSIFTKIKPTTKYEVLTLKQNTVLHTLSQLTNYQDEIKKIINEPITTKTEDSDNLLWLWITLPLFLVFLIFGFGFYFYRSKKLSIAQLKKPKK